MLNISDEFSKVVHAIGMDELNYPSYHNSPVGIRFEIGGDESVYLDNKHTKKLIANPAYICVALNRAKSIYASLPHNPNILRIDGYPSKNRVKKFNQKDLPVMLSTHTS